MTVYFDNAATTRVRDEAAKKVLEMMCDHYGNPSSTHKMGRDAKAALDLARKSVAESLGAHDDEIYFTSGGTEADNWAIFGASEFMRHKGKHIIATASEHDAVLKPIKLLVSRGYDITYLKPDSNGHISPEEFAHSLRDDTVLVSVMLVNNETGSINPVGECAKILKSRGSQALIHTDAVQGFCKLDFKVKSLGADLVTVSAHKIHGPKGAGALYIRRGVKLQPYLFGGGQENDQRAGTEALPAIVGFGEAARLGTAEVTSTAIKMRGIRDYIIRQLHNRLPDAVVIGTGDAPHILSISLPGYKSEVLMNFLESEGIFVSKSSACKKGGRSHVLEAMSLPKDIIDGTIRLSFSRESTTAEADYFIDKLLNASSKLFKVLK